MGLSMTFFIVSGLVLFKLFPIRLVLYDWNDENELVTPQIHSGWQVCNDNRKLNDATRKDHFSLPFLTKILERLVIYSFYYFLDGCYGYTHISITPID